MVILSSELLRILGVSSTSSRIAALARPHALGARDWCMSTVASVISVLPL
jgi:hypothetical protein